MSWVLPAEESQTLTDLRYNELFFMIDTCQANTLYSKFYSPNIIATGSSGKGENSYSVGLELECCACVLRRTLCLQHHSDPDIGVAVIDRFTHFAMEQLEHVNQTSEAKLMDLVRLSFSTRSYLSSLCAVLDL